MASANDLPDYIVGNILWKEIRLKTEFRLNRIILKGIMSMAYLFISLVGRAEK